MSKVAIKGATTGTGTFTIESPATNTDRTLVLPDAAGTVALTSDIPAAPTIASTAEAEAGTNNTNFITPLRMREGFNAGGSAPVYACRAWVNFDGLTGSGNTIRGSGNVSSVTRNGTGDYTINFTTAMPDANYVLNGTCGGVSISEVVSGWAYTSGNIKVQIWRGNTNTQINSPDIGVSIFR